MKESKINLNLNLAINAFKIKKAMFQNKKGSEI